MRAPTFFCVKLPKTKPNLIFFLRNDFFRFFDFQHEECPLEIWPCFKIPKYLRKVLKSGVRKSYIRFQTCVKDFEHFRTWPNYKGTCLALRIEKSKAISGSLKTFPALFSKTLRHLGPNVAKFQRNSTF